MSRAPYLDRTLWQGLVNISAGGVSGQLLGLLGALLVTRLYLPEALGEYAVYTSTLLIVTPLACLSLTSAIALARTDDDAVLLARVGLSLSILAAAIFALALVILGHWVVLPRAVYWAPIGVLIAVLFNTIHQHYLREGANSSFGAMLLGQSLVTQCGKISAGFAGYATGQMLVIAAILGQLLPLAHALRRTAWLRPIRLSREHIAIIDRYREFPTHQLPQQLLGATAQALPIFLLTILGSTESAAYYAITMLVLSLPSQVFGRYVGDSFFGHFARLLVANRDLEQTRAEMQTQWRRVTVLMLTVAAVPFLALGLVGPDLFAWIFGPTWAPAGEFASAMAIWMWLAFANTPALKVLILGARQHWNTRLSLLTLPVRAVAVAYGMTVVGDPLVAVTLLAVAGVMHNLGLYTLAVVSLRAPAKERPV